MFPPRVCTGGGMVNVTEYLLWFPAVCRSPPSGIDSLRETSAALRLAAEVLPCFRLNSERRGTRLCPHSSVQDKTLAGAGGFPTPFPWSTSLSRIQIVHNGFYQA